MQAQYSIRMTGPRLPLYSNRLRTIAQVQYWLNLNVSYLRLSDTVLSITHRNSTVVYKRVDELTKVSPLFADSGITIPA